jgi:methylthioribose-1-phosphate isomerase
MALSVKDFAVYTGEFMTPKDVVDFTTRALNHLRTSRPTAVNLFNMADAYVMPMMRFGLFS